MKRLPLALVLVAVFALGFGGGWIVHQIYYEPVIVQWEPPDPIPMPTSSITP